MEKLKYELKADIIEAVKEMLPKENSPKEEEKEEKIKEPKKGILEEIGEVDEEEEKRKAEVDIELIVDEPKDRPMQLEDVVNRDDLYELNRKMEADSIKEEGSKYKDYSFPDFIDAVTRDFGLTSAPICNYVNNSGSWNRATTFYINSYKKLSVTPPEGENYQLKEPETIHDFWKWLYKNQHRIGDVINIVANPTVQMLNIRYKDATLYVEGNLSKFYEVVEHNDNSVTVTVKRDGKIYIVRDRWDRVKYNTNEADKLIFHYISEAWLFNQATF